MKKEKRMSGKFNWNVINSDQSPAKHNSHVRSNSDNPPNSNSSSSTNQKRDSLECEFEEITLPPPKITRSITAPRLRNHSISCNSQPNLNDPTTKVTNNNHNHNFERYSPNSDATTPSISSSGSGYKGSNSSRNSSNESNKNHNQPIPTTISHHSDNILSPQQTNEKNKNTLKNMEESWIEFMNQVKTEMKLQDTLEYQRMKKDVSEFQFKMNILSILLAEEENKIHHLENENCDLSMKILDLQLLALKK